MGEVELLVSGGERVGLAVLANLESGVLVWVLE